MRRDKASLKDKARHKAKANPRARRELKGIESPRNPPSRKIPNRRIVPKQVTRINQTGEEGIAGTGTGPETPDKKAIPEIAHLNRI